MSLSSRTLSIIAGLTLGAASSWAALPGLQGDVKGPDGKPVSGASVRIDFTNGKQMVSTVKTDKNGHYVAHNLEVKNYNITVVSPGMATTAATNVKTRIEGDVRIDFTLKRAIAGGDTKTAPVATKKAHKRMVWVPSETGSNLGGRWVDVDDGGNTAPSALNVKRGGAGSVSAAQNGSGSTRGGN
jgi:hypothetical protein